MKARDLVITPLPAPVDTDGGTPSSTKTRREGQGVAGEGLMRSKRGDACHNGMGLGDTLCQMRVIR